MAVAAPPLPHNYYRRRRHCCCRCCLCTFLVLVLVLLVCLLALAGAGLYAWLRPSFPEFRVERLNVTRLDRATAGDHAVLTTGVNLFLESRNKNYRIKFDYDKITVQVSSADRLMILGRESVPKFSQPERNMTVIRVGTGVANMVVDDYVGREMAKNFKEGRMEVNVKMESMVGAVVGGHHAGRIPITVRCDHVYLAKVATGDEPRCKLYFGGWIRLN